MAMSIDRPHEKRVTPSGGSAVVGDGAVTEVRLDEALEAMPLAVALFDERLVLQRANSRFHALTRQVSAGLTGAVTLTALFPDWQADRELLGDVSRPGDSAAARTMRFVVRGSGSSASGSSSNGGGSGAAHVIVEATLTALPERNGRGRTLCFAGRVLAPSDGLIAWAAETPEQLEERYVDRLVKERAQELLHRQDVRERERRLAAVGQLAAGVMHDVNNALNPIVAAAHLITLHADNPSAVRDYAARIARAAETGVATAARVGRFIRQEPTAEAPDAALIDLSLSADEVIAMTRPTWTARALGGTVELRRSLADGVMARGLVGEVNEALLNLVQNALDAMAAAGGGVLGIETRVEGVEAIVEVSDTGAGMSPEVVERAFEPFFTTKGARGTGLGLSEVYGIMKRHRGRAEIESRPGQGTTVRLVFPLATALTASGEIHAFLDRVPKRVLVVDSDRPTRDFVAAILVADGHVVDCAASLAEGMSRLANAAARHGRYELLLVAPELHDGRCSALIDGARSRWDDVRVGILAPRDGERWYEPFADFSLTTPVRPDELLAFAAVEA